MDTKTNEEYQNEIEKIKSKKYLTVNEREKIIEEIHNLQNESKQEKDVKNKEKLESQATKKRRELSESYMKLVLRIASKYADTPKEIMDLAADGTIGLINGIDNYTNNNRETPFSNYIHNYIEQAIQQKIKTTPEEEVP